MYSSISHASFQYNLLLIHVFLCLMKQPIDWDEAIVSREADKSVGPIEWAAPGYDEAMKTLKSFIDKRLKIFSTKRNDPTQDALSNLSPWFHFGKTIFYIAWAVLHSISYLEMNARLQLKCLLFFFILYSNLALILGHPFRKYYN